MSLSLELGRFVSGLRYEHLPADVLRAIKAAFADTIGVAIAGAGESAPRIVKSIVTPAGTNPRFLADKGGRQRSMQPG